MLFYNADISTVWGGQSGTICWGVQVGGGGVGGKETLTQFATQMKLSISLVWDARKKKKVQFKQASLILDALQDLPTFFSEDTLNTHFLCVTQSVNDAHVRILASISWTP
ncbi:hypothetical protein BaRGS_00005421 [Batillaria attramentaria]|uniref:Uncharacterized protein n=1 Tax=Batillaria attramentaria TaxID=370345 RepID=A0ABD0LVI6_9CAEN